MTPRLCAYVGGPDKDTSGAIGIVGIAALNDAAVLGIDVPDVAWVPRK